MIFYIKTIAENNDSSASAWWHSARWQVFARYNSRFPISWMVLRWPRYH